LCNVKDLELRACTDALRMGPASERPMLLRSSVGLHDQAFLFDGLDVRLFTGGISVSIGGGYSEPSGYEQHVVLTQVRK